MRAFLILAPLILSLQTHALVRVVDNCYTPDHSYRILITDNQGTKVKRHHRFTASIQDKKGRELAAFGVEEDRGLGTLAPKSARFLDRATQGRKFKLVFPSPSDRHISIKAILRDGKKLQDQNLSCTGDSAQPMSP